MKIKKLSHDFYNDHKDLLEALDLVKGEWKESKERGHGIVQIVFKGLVFAIPLRSVLKHDAGCHTVGTKGLDFSKALLITDPDKYITEQEFKIDGSELHILRTKEHSLKKNFGKYVSRYIKAKKKNDKNVLRSMKYRYTTLQNYDDILLVN